MSENTKKEVQVKRGFGEILFSTLAATITEEMVSAVIVKYAPLIAKAIKEGLSKIGKDEVEPKQD